MKIILSGFLSLILLLLVLELSAQSQFQYNQYMQNMVPVNPAASLMKQQASINLVSHLQWAGVDGAPKTQLLSGSIPIKKINATGGLLLSFDEIGVERNINLSAFIAKSIKLSEGQYLGLSINGGLQSFKGSYAELSATDKLFNANLNERSAVAGIGLTYYSPDKFYFGLSIPSIKLKSSALLPAENRAYLTGAYLSTINNDFSLKTAALVSYANDELDEANLSAVLLIRDSFGIGAGYGTNKNVLGLLSYKIKQQFTLSYTYQTSTGYLNGISGSTHEIGLGFSFGKSDRLMP